MEIYHFLSVESFVKGWRRSDSVLTFTLPAVHLMHAALPAQYEYGLSLLRKAIGLYEEKRGIPTGESKREMPFFRENSRMLVGPEVELYILSFYEHFLLGGHPDSVAGLQDRRGAMQGKRPVTTESDVLSVPRIALKLDAEKLAHHCLTENMFFLRCKYEEEQILQTFTAQMEREYDKFFYDDEHSGFTADSRFFSLLCNAVLEVGLPACTDEREWRLAVFKSPEEVEYRYADGKLVPFFEVSIPIDSIRQIRLENYPAHPLLYGSLAGFLKSKGLSPQRYLEGMQD